MLPPDGWRCSSPCGDQFEGDPAESSSSKLVPLPKLSSIEQTACLENRLDVTIISILF